MEDHFDSFHDYSTLEGRLSLFLHRIKWKYVIPPAVFLGAFAAIAVMIVMLQSDLKPAIPNDFVQKLSPGNSLLGKDDPFMDETGEKTPGWTIIKMPQPDVVEAEGCENGLYPFGGFDSTIPVTTIKSLRIRNLMIEAAELTKSLEGWSSLESIVIENVWVSGDYTRVYLPNLKKFIYQQYRNVKTDQYKDKSVLKQILFFDKSPTETWDLEADLLNLNMTIQVTIEGTKILDIEPDRGEIFINTHTCEEMYKYFDEKRAFPLSTLSLNWCPVGNTTINKLAESGKTLEFLFLNNAVPNSTRGLEEMIKSLENLKELHLFQRFRCDWPGYEIYLNVSELPEKLETLSVTNLDLSFAPGLSANSITNLSLDQYVGEDVVGRFPSIFPNLESLALFNVTGNRSYNLLETVLFSMTKVKLLIVTDLTRSKTREKVKQDLHGNFPAISKINRAGTAGANAVEKVEDLLKAAGVPEDASCFKLELGENKTYVGRELTSFERNFLRFERLAFRKIDTYADYVTWDADPK